MTPETMSPREKVFREVLDAVFSGFEHGQCDKEWEPPYGKEIASLATDAIIAALASSGDHAELARLAEWRDRLRADPGRAAHFGSPYADKPMQNGRTYWNSDLADDITTLIAEVAALRGAKWEVQHVDTMNDMVLMGMARDDAEARATEAERKLAEAVEWRPIETAPRDGRFIVAMMGDAQARWEHLNGRAFVVRHEGTTDSGYNLGWSVYPGFGGVSDQWFSGWLPLPPAPGAEA